MKKQCSILLLLLPLLCFTQEKGIIFEQAANWEAVKAKAQKDNKYIFVDCYTTWCGPCKRMDSEVFPLEKVGDFFNTRFVSLKLQMDRTDADNEAVKAWYSEADRMNKEYIVHSYPTYLIFDAKGELVHRIVGGTDADKFLALVEEVFDPKKQYAALLQKFEDYPTDSAVARQVIDLAYNIMDDPLLEKAGDRYLALVGGEALLNKENIELLTDLVTSSKSQAYKFIKENKKAVDKLLAERKLKSANDILASVLVYEFVKPEFVQTGAVDFRKLEAKITQDHPYVDIRPCLLEQEAEYYFIGYAPEMNWAAFVEAVNDLALLYDKLREDKLASYASKVFIDATDKAHLKAALSWAKKALEGMPEADTYISLYADLLYKTGDRDNAIKWKEQAIAKSYPENLEGHKASLEMMKKGETTWNTAKVAP